MSGASGLDVGRDDTYAEYYINLPISVTTGIVTIVEQSWAGVPTFLDSRVGIPAERRTTRTASLSGPPLTKLRFDSQNSKVEISINLPTL